MTTHAEQREPKSLAKACLFCRRRKIRCDAARPSCAACKAHGRECVYRLEAPKKRPTLAEIHGLRQKCCELEALLHRVRIASPQEREILLAANESNEGHAQLPGDEGSPKSPLDERVDNPTGRSRRGSVTSLGNSSDEGLDVGQFISVDEAGEPSSFGPSSALQFPSKSSQPYAQTARSRSLTQAKNELIANAALQRQSEASLAYLPDIDGVPTELALHLLDVHWSRQHHTFLLTYRPAIMRDLPTNGPHCSRFLLNAIFACSSKFSGRVEVRDDPADRSSAGRRFFRRCDQLIATESLLIHPTLCTLIGLLLLGSTFNARGETSKGWLYTGYALRMVYDLGLHIDPSETTTSSEEVEIRRRVFWGAFVCDKLQSLYLGRPVAINLRDSSVSREFIDTMEERDLYLPYLDPKYPSNKAMPFGVPPFIYSVSTFQQFCLLSRIMTTIINRLYVVGAIISNAKTCLEQVDRALSNWREKLPKEIDFLPPSEQQGEVAIPAPNVMNLHGIYHTLIILLHRPFISDGHLRSITAPADSWKKCTAAAKSITDILLSYKSAYGLTDAPYLLSYIVYVACTIHVRNAGAENRSSREHLSLLAKSLMCLDDMSLANPGVRKPANIIRQLMAVHKLDLDDEQTTASNVSPGSLDLEAIMGMFPSKPPSLNPIQNPVGPYVRDMFDVDFPYDPLFGLMDVPTMPFGDVSDMFMGTSNS